MSDSRPRRRRDRGSVQSHWAHRLPAWDQRELMRRPGDPAAWTYSRVAPITPSGTSGLTACGDPGSHSAALSRLIRRQSLGPPGVSTYSPRQLTASSRITGSVAVGSSRLLLHRPADSLAILTSAPGH